MTQRISSTLLDEARAARERASMLYLADSNTNLVDVGWRIKESQGRRMDPQLTVRVHVRRKLRGAALESLGAVRPQSIVSQKAIGFPCDVIQSSYRLHAGFFPFATAGVSPQVRGARRLRPLQGGISAMWEGGTTATLGGIVLDRVGRMPMILSNWHVLAGSAFAPRGQRILQAAPFDGGRPAADTVATLERDAMAVGIDAAVATLLPEVQFVNNQFGIGSVSGSAPAELDMHVIKAGRTTGVTEGIVDGIDGELLMTYAGFSRSIRHVVHIAPFNTLNVSAGGDSGSWHLEKSSRRAVGLHFAGSDVPDYALAISMPRVLDALGVDLALQGGSS